MDSFLGALASASNLVPDNLSAYTAEMFLADFPQFSKREETGDGEIQTVSLVPESMLAMFLRMANGAIQESRWFEAWRYAMGLYVAHFATMYLRSHRETSQTPSDAANTGQTVGNIASATLGDSSVSYDNTAIQTATQQWGTWNATTYGQELITQARLLAMGGTYAI